MYYSDEQDDLLNSLRPLSFKKSGHKSHALHTPPSSRAPLAGKPSMSLFDTSSPAYNSPSPPKFDTASGTDASPNETRYCSMKACRALLKHTRYRTCDICRQKNRERASRRRQKDRLDVIQAALGRPSTALQNTKAPTVASLFKEKRFKLYMSQLRQKGLLFYVEGYDDAKGASGKRKAHDEVGGVHSPKKPKTHVSDGYQTAEDLYAEIRRAIDKVQDFSFCGFFHVVRSLDEEATKSRAQREVSKMMDETGLKLR